MDTPTIAIIAKEGYGHTDWKAYTGTTSDPPTEAELELVLTHGNKVNREKAERLFPEFAKKYTWRT